MRYLRSINSDLLHSLIWGNLIAIALGLCAIMLMNFLSSKKQNLKLPFSGPVFILVLCYVISVAAITIIPVPYTEHFKTSTINLVPVANTYENLVDPVKRQSSLLAADVAMNIIGNILMFIPLGMIITRLFRTINT
jgi:glycopeptide antibiotics resistance protein